jgi:hypothetical protein
MRESIVLVLKTTAPDVYCLSCLGQAFPDVVDLDATVRALIADGAPIEIRWGACCVCQLAAPVTGYQSLSL